MTTPLIPQPQPPTPPQAPQPLQPTIPVDCDEKTMEVLLKRVELIEGEIFKQIAAVQTRAGAGIGGCIALLGAMIGARDTLWWRLSSDNQIALWFIGFEALALVAGFVCLWLAYSNTQGVVGPDIQDNQGLNELLNVKVTEARGMIVKTVQVDNKTNQDFLGDWTSLLNTGFACLAALALALVIHGGVTANIKSEVEKAEKKLAIAEPNINETIGQETTGEGVHDGSRAKTGKFDGNSEQRPDVNPSNPPGSIATASPSTGSGKPLPPDSGNKATFNGNQ